MAFSYSVSNTSNYTPPGFTFTDVNAEFPAIYGNANFAYTVSFSTDLGTITGISVNSSPAYTTETVLDSSSVRIERDETEAVFAGESYDFVNFTDEQNKTFENYIPSQTDNASSNTAIFRWNTPSVEIITGTYEFTITYTSSETMTSESETVSYTQDLHWSIEPGLISLLDLVDRSKF